MYGLIFVFTVFCLALAYLSFLLRRNKWVCEQCIRVLEEQGVNEFARLPSYAFMLYARPCIWDIEKFKRPSS
jgi:hypothetical protein